VPSPGTGDAAASAEAFAQVARVLIEQPDLASTLQRIVDLAVATVDDCEWVGISEVRGKAISSPAASSPAGRVIDRIQAEVGEGPCVDALRRHEVFRTDDLLAEQRWPLFTNRAFAETGVRSILSVRLYVEQQTLGALNLYSTRPAAFSDADVTLAIIFATHASVGFAAARRSEQLEARAASRDLIGRAKGILMALHRVTDDQAFRMLIEASQRLNVKLIDVAADVNDTGELG
jgi:GAF domain-containing protein